MSSSAAVLTRSAEPCLSNGLDSDRAHPRTGLLALTIGSIGVVYGDIGTSPLYAFREALLAASAGGPLGREAVIGVVSLILWALILIVTVKYVLVLLRADNDGEGGTLSLMALAQRAMRKSTGCILLLGIAGAALFYGDAIITPAISVLSAVEGLELVTPAFEGSILPITVAILVALFTVQSHGTGRVAACFGPVMSLWFVAMAAAGLVHLRDDLDVLAAFDPLHAIRFLTSHGLIGLATLGAVFLAVTGAEALYADLGHFGRRPIRTAWFALVFPALALNYLGQGALVLKRPEAIANPFFLLVPSWALLPMVALATAATVIASQAVITGAYSISRQATQLGLLPRLEIRHTSEAHSGQIYVPRINAFLLVGVLLLVGLFQSSTHLASAYGIAVTGTMVVTALLAFIVIRKVWGWSLPLTAMVITPLLALDLAFLGANLLKLLHGGWVPLLLGALLMTVMLTWRRGSEILFEKTRRAEVPLQDLVASLERHPPHRVPGTAVFLTSDPESAPTALLHNLKHNKILHEKNVILTIRFADTPHVPASERVTLEPLSEGFSRLILRFGFVETPNVPRALAIARRQGFAFDIMSTSFFLSRRKVKAAANSSMRHWQDRLFITLARNADDATDYFQIPTGRVVEVGTQVAV
ncbi:potassium transporter Kup [Benzoatithermus flavus]|uniref:Probable potassium transport system protein Kup n=1 Tax=Benzoatithermus flavus TaxID=3108223 RepID=A0ABU8XYX9_9PROT